MVSPSPRTGVNRACGSLNVQYIMKKVATAERLAPTAVPKRCEVNNKPFSSPVGGKEIGGFVILHNLASISVFES